MTPVVFVLCLLRSLGITETYEGKRVQKFLYR